MLDKNNSGKVSVDYIQEVYNASQHPEVKKGLKSEEEILTTFLQTFETYLSNNSIGDFVTVDDFLDYYTFISSSIDNDEYFEMMMQNAWQL